MISATPNPETHGEPHWCSKLRKAMPENRAIPTIALPPTANAYPSHISLDSFVGSFASDIDPSSGSSNTMPVKHSNDWRFGSSQPVSFSGSNGGGNVVKSDLLRLFVLSRRRAPWFVLVFTIMTVLSYSFLPSSTSFLILRNYKTLSDVPYDDALDLHAHVMNSPFLPGGDDQEIPYGHLDGSAAADENSGLTAPSLQSVKEGMLHLTELRPGTTGFPPADLPPDHPNAELLGEIRALTTLRPRWPSVNETPIFTLRSYGPSFSSIVVSHKLKVVYIPVFKVGSSSIMWCLAFLENLEEVLKYKDGQSEERHMALHDTSLPVWANHTIQNMPEQDVAAVFRDPSYMKFGFVRNPYDRAVSAYTDKIVRADATSQEYRRLLYSLFGTHNWTAMHSMNSSTQQQQQQQQQRERPTFSQFMHAVQRVTSQPRMQSPHSFDSESGSELHWRPQSEQLHPDLIQLDFVGRFERMDADLEVVLEWMYRHTTQRIPKDMKIKLQATDPAQKAHMLETLGEDQTLVDCIQSVYSADFHRFHYSTTIPDIEGIPHQIE